MGRKLYRVPLDFTWPLGKVWEGYLNPHNAVCPEENKTCFNGYTAAGKWLDAICRFTGLLADGVIRPLHPWVRDFSQAPTTSIPDAVMRELRNIDDRQERNKEVARALVNYPSTVIAPTPELLDLFERFTGEKIPPHLLGGHFPWRLAQRFKEVAGVDQETWGVCPVCKGHNIDPAIYATHEAWQPTPPPEGPGFQLWTTTNEGAPISSVFQTLDELCAWCADNATTFADIKATKEEWRQMLDEDFVHATRGDMVFM